MRLEASSIVVCLLVSLPAPSTAADTPSSAVATSVAPVAGPAPPATTPAPVVTPATPAGAGGPTRASLPGPTSVKNTKMFEESLRATQQALAFYGRYDNPVELERVTRIGYEVAQYSGFTDVPYTFYLIDMPEPNAIALPGGQIFVTRGMLALGLDDDELACLLGHEITHVAAQHGTKMEKRATLVNLLAQVAILGAIVGASNSGSRDNPSPVYDPWGYEQRDSGGDIVTGTYAASVLLGELLLRSYSREFEDQSDEEGQRWAAAAGYDPSGTEKLMSMMRDRIPESNEYGYWRSHPFFVERVTAANARAVYLTRQPPRPDAAYRQATQAALLDWVTKSPAAKPEPVDGRRRGPKGETRREPGDTDPRSGDPRSGDPRSGDPADRNPPDGDTRGGDQDGDRGGDRQPADDGDGGRPGGPRYPHRLEPLAELVEHQALLAWPQGDEADRLRLKALHATRDRELTRPELSRDYGQLLTAYDAAISSVGTLTPQSPALATLHAERDELTAKRDAIYPQAQATLAGDVFETRFLETFIANFPDRPERARAALKLGEAYNRLGRQTEAVERFLEAWNRAPESSEGIAAREGLRIAAPYLEKLAALEELAAQTRDLDLAKVATDRLEKLSSTYADIANGAEYLARFPDGRRAAAVDARREVLAQQLFGEIVLYQSVGDHVKALERIQSIFEQAPMSKAATQLRERMLAQTQKT
jgi:predicted Zn-dependent protease